MASVGFGSRAESGVAQALGPDPQHDLFTLVAAARAGQHRARPRRHRQPAAAFVEHQRPTLVEQLAAQEVHRRRAEESGHEPVRGMVVDLERAAALLDHAVLHHHDPIAQRHRLFLIVRDVDRGASEPQVQPLDLGAHARRAASRPGSDSGSSNRKRCGSRTIARPSATRCRCPPDSACGLRSSSVRMPRIAAARCTRLVDLRFGDLPQLQRERHVLVHRHVRVERVVLEHHRDVAILGRDVVDHALADPDRARA